MSMNFADPMDRAIAAIGGPNVRKLEEAGLVLMEAQWREFIRRHLLKLSGAIQVLSAGSVDVAEGCQYPWNTQLRETLHQAGLVLVGGIDQRALDEYLRAAGWRAVEQFRKTQLVKRPCPLRYNYDEELQEELVRFAQWLLTQSGLLPLLLAQLPQEESVLQRKEQIK